jgi:hypothetical protein
MKVIKSEEEQHIIGYSFKKNLGGNDKPKVLLLYTTGYKIGPYHILDHVH